MKNVYRRFGIIVLVAIIGFSFTVCSNGSTGGGGGIRVTVNNIPADAAKVYLYLIDTMSGEQYSTVEDKQPPISGNSASATFYKDDFGIVVAPYITNDMPALVYLRIEYNGDTDEWYDDYDEGYYSYETCTFSDSTFVLNFPYDFTDDYPFY